MTLYIERPRAAETVDVQRSPWIQLLLLAMAIAYVNLAVFILVFSEPPQFKHLLWAAGLGIASALLTCQRSPKPDAQRETVAQS